MMDRFASPTLCGCCEAPADATPQLVHNRPALSAIAYRIGTFATFRQAMLEAIAHEPALARLTTREADDYAITLLELWSALGDVLTFYQERIANEAFLRTAVHRDSVLRLARLLDYHLRPGLAARARVAFTLDEGATVNIPPALKLMSVPGQDERPQFFETVERIVAEARLNAVRVRPMPAPFNAFAQGRTRAPLMAQPSPLGAGDRLVFYVAFRVEEKSVVDVEARDTGTYLTWAPAVQDARFDPRAMGAARYSRQLRFFGFDAPASFPRYEPGAIVGGVWNPPPRWETVPIDGAFGAGTVEYPLDTRYEDLKPGTALLVDTGTAPDPIRLATVVQTTQKSATLGALTDTVTHVTLTRGLADAPVVVSQALSRLDVLATSGSFSGLHLEWNGAWQGWSALGGVLSSRMAAASWAPDRLDVFVRGTDSALYHRWRSGAGAWSPAGHQWERLGGILTSRPTVVARAANRLDVFVRGLDLALWHRAWNGAAWSAWQSLGGVLTSAPVAVARTASAIDVFVRGTDRALWMRSWDGTQWHPWRRVGGVLSRDIAAISRSASHLDVFARAADDTLWHAGWDGGEWRTASRGGALVGAPAVASWSASRLDVFVRGRDDALWQIFRDGAHWSQWVALGGVLTSDPAAVSWGPGRVDVFARGADHGLMHRAWNGSWSAWQPRGLGLGDVSDRRATRVWQLDAPQMAFRIYDYADAISGSTVAVPLRELEHIEDKRAIVLDSKDTAPLAARVTATRRISATGEDDADHLLIDFAPALGAPLETATARLRGNIAWTTHGESVPEEILGDGDSAAAFQRFTLRRLPLTYLTTPRSARGQAQLAVFANGEQWTEVENLYGRGAHERVYTVRQTDEGTSEIRFGDGVTGARLPSGRGNVRAAYRQGAGLEGRLRADQLSILLARPPGLKDATNPLPAEGGADPEPLDQARTRAPTTVRTFGRAISLADFEALATASGEVAKAKATWVWRGLERVVHVSIAGQSGAPFSAETLRLLHSGLTAARDPNHMLLLGNVCRVGVRVVATIAVEKSFLREDVLAAAREALAAFVSFERMPIARALHQSDLYAALQAVRGVAFVDLDHFHLRGVAAWSDAELASRGATADPVQRHLRMFEARPLRQAMLDPAVRGCFPGPLPEVLPAEQAYAEAGDLVLSATGGIA
jgi:hypothetical protein